MSARNTRVRYQYSDAANYHAMPEQALGHAVIVAGELTAAEQTEILSYCEGEEFFIPSQVGLSDLQFYLTDKYGWDEDDHVFHRLTGFESTDAPANAPCSAAELLAAFRGVGDGRNWDTIAALRRLGHEFD